MDNGSASGFMIGKLLHASEAPVLASLKNYYHSHLCRNIPFTTIPTIKLP